MLKFNLPNLNKLRNINKQRPESEVCKIEPEQELAVRVKPKYSAYRTVLVNHDRMRERIKEPDAQGCDNACAEGKEQIL